MGPHETTKLVDFFVQMHIKKFKYIIVVLDSHPGGISTQFVDPTRRPRGAPNN